jgi:Tol biopolymer transport system component
MSLAPGTRLGVYELVGQIGAGGMGEVYRARDPRLGRDVAIKVLPAAFAADPGRLQRFEQEARAAAALNHPNILAVHDIGQHDGAPFIVSELLEGETLRERLHGGALPVRKAIEYGVQIAQGLAAAHEKGIVHRDLKPENLFVTEDGRVKILDFGLAKLTQAEPALGGLSVLPTAAPGTLPGMVLGTIGYMAPEQVRGHTADHRSDIFALGTILYEMLAGHRAFRGDTGIDTMTAILKEDPPDLSAAERHIPAGLERIVDRCLEKNPSARFQSTRDLAFALEALSSHSEHGPRTDAVVAIPGRRSRERVAWMLAGTLLAACAASIALGTMGYLRPVAPPASVKLSILPPDGVLVNALALSPDGRYLAFTARSGGNVMLWIRALESTTASPLAGTEGANGPFWSPDSRSVAFFANGKLNRISPSGGPVQALADTTGAFGGTWNEAGVILFAPAQFASIYRVSASGGTPAQLTTLDAAKNESSHRWPVFLPDGRHFLYSVVRNVDAVDIRVGDIESGETTQLAQSDSEAAYVRTPAGDYLLFTRQATLLAQAFDVDALQVTGEPTPVTEEALIRGARPGDGSSFSVSASGVIAYRPGGAVVERELVWTDRAGKSLGSVGARGLYEHLDLAPDAKRIALSSIELQSQQLDIWWMDATAGSTTRFTFDPGQYDVPRWSPDGSRLTFPRVGTRKGIYEKLSNGAGGENQIFASPHDGLVIPNDWSPDGRFLVFADTPPQQRGNLWMLPQFGDRRPAQVFQNEDVAQRNGRFSPDGRWLAYESLQPRGVQVYVQPFPASGAKWQISRAGGMKPRWRRDGKELYFIEPGSRALMAAPIMGGEVFQPGVPTPLFTLQYASRLIAQYPYDVSDDGQRFLIISPEAEAGITPITVLLNWSGQPAR